MATAEVKRWDSTTLEDRLELAHRGGRRPRLSATQELAIFGAADLAVEVKKARLEIKAIEERAELPESALRQVIPSSLYGFTVPNKVQVQLSPQTEQELPFLSDVIDHAGSNAKLLVEELHVECRGGDLQKILSALQELLEDGSEIRAVLAEYNEGVLESLGIPPIDELIKRTEKKGSKRLLIDLLGPDGEPIKTIQRYRELYPEGTDISQ